MKDLLLGIKRDFIKSAWRERGDCCAPDREALFQREGDNFHFRGLVNKTTKGVTAQHVVMSDSVVKAVYTIEDRLVFLIETKPGAVVRQEMESSPHSRLHEEWGSGPRHGTVVVVRLSGVRALVASK